MNIEKQLNDIASTYQNILEKNVINFPTGTCYLSAYCLFQYFSRIGLEANVIIGDLALLNITNKYAVYGTRNLKKSINVGDYHAWCQVIIDKIIYLVDPSIKYNAAFLKTSHNFKISKKIPDSIITNDIENYYWKYTPNEKLIHHYEKWISQAPEKIKLIIIEELVKNHPTFL